jgi:YVTN family beta-propeller protein
VAKFARDEIMSRRARRGYNETLLDRRTFLLTPLVALAACHRKASRFPGYAFVANSGDQAIGVVDLKEFVLARHIRLDASPTAILGHPQRSFIYALTPESGAIHEIDTGSFRVTRSVRLAREAVAMRLSPDGSAIWVLCRQARQLARVPLDSLRPDTRIPLAAEPADFDLSGDGKAAVSYGTNGGIGIVDLPRRASRFFDVCKASSFVRFRHDDRQIFTGDTAERTFTILDAPTGNVVVRLPLAVRPDRICIKADGGQAFVSGEGLNAVAVIYPYLTEVAETVLAGRAPGEMAECAASDADYLFVANPASGQVTIVDIDTRRVIAAVTVGQGPRFITTTPDGQYALVLNRDSGDMAVIRLASVVSDRTKSAPLFTMIPVGSNPVCAIVRQTG